MTVVSDPPREGPCPVCQGAGQWNAKGQVVWTKPANEPVTRCPFCLGTGYARIPSRGAFD